MISLLIAAAIAAPARCTYEYSVWNVEKKASGAVRRVDKPYANLVAAEKGPERCTPCSEDQEEISLSNGIKFRACRAVSRKISQALEGALKRGQKIESIVGYRAQMSRGPADREGNRTELSNHAFGVAIDVNEEHNGLYEKCTTWSAKCVLRKGGKYTPGFELSLVKGSPLVEEMANAGFRWGGEIAGVQKDFMHFSPTGY